MRSCKLPRNAVGFPRSLRETRQWRRRVRRMDFCLVGVARDEQSQTSRFPRSSWRLCAATHALGHVMHAAVRDMEPARRCDGSGTRTFGAVIRSGSHSSARRCSACALRRAHYDATRPLDTHRRRLRSSNWNNYCWVEVPLIVLENILRHCNHSILGIGNCTG